MRKSLFLFALLSGLLVFAPAWAQEQKTVDLAGEWKLFKGDNKSYATLAFDDALWKPVTAPGAWQTQGNPDLKGFAWYRKHVSLPAEWGRDPLVRDGKLLKMDLGKIADAYEIFWNGELIAVGGKFPPALAVATDIARAGIPADKSNFSGDNVLAVRVYASGAASGILEGPLAIRKPVFADFLNVSVVGKDNRTEFVGPEGLPFDIMVENVGPSAWQKGTVIVSVFDGAGNQLLTNPMMVDVNPQKVYRATMQLKDTDLNPGIYTVAAATQMAGETFQTTSKTFVFNPGGIRCETFRTPDQIRAFTTKLDTFWKTTTTALKSAVLSPTATLDAAKSNDKVKIYKVAYNALNGQAIHGWLAVPANATKSPGVVVLPGYGNSSIDPPAMLAESGFAALAINVLGSEVDAKTYAPEADVYTKGGLENPDTFAMRGMVAAGLKAVDFLAQRPEVNPERIGVIGMSQGGGLALDVASLDPRVRVVVASSPAADFTRMFAQAKRNPAAVLITGLPPEKRIQLDQTMAIFDPAFLAKGIRVPTMLTIGMKDNVTPPETAYAVKAAIPQGVAVTIVADENSGHQVTPNQAASSLGWLKKFLIG